MTTRPTVDQKTRQRIAANVRRLKHEWEFKSDTAMARFLGVSKSAVNRGRKGERGIGLDVLLAIHRKLGQSMDGMCDRDELAGKWLDPDYKGPPRKKNGG